jgi:DNA-binding MurR/RpiR family transcriptional regulator
VKKALAARGPCLLRIEGALESFGRAERKLADYVRAHPHETVQCTIEELEERSGASYATVNRFCRRLGFAGYKELRKALIADMAPTGPAPAELLGVSVAPGDTSKTIADKILASSIALLEETQAILDAKTVEKVVRVLCDAEQTVFVGTGTSGLTAHYAASRFFRIGLRSLSESDSTIMRQRATVLGKKDVLFAISSSGRSASVVEAADAAARAGASVVSLCDYAISPLSCTARLNLYTTPRNAGHHLDKEMPLLVGQIALVDVLFAGCCTRLGARVDVNRLYEATRVAANAEKLKGK